MVRIFIQETVLCVVCKQPRAKYECPSWHQNYCKVQCYKEHNQTCTETFYKSQVEAHLANVKVSNTRSIHRILEKYKDTDTPEILTEIQEKRLAKLLESADSPSVFALMTASEKAEFDKFVLTEYSEEKWVAWWETQRTTPSVQENDVKRYNDLPQVSDLTSKTPSSSLIYYVCRVAWSAAYVWCLYNGDESMMPEMMELLNSLSTLSSRSTEEFSCLESALAHCIQHAYSLDHSSARVFVPVALSDLSLLLCKGNLVELLFKIHDICHFHHLSSFKKHSKTLGRAKHKIFFYLCYVKELSDSFLTEVKHEADALDKHFPLKRHEE